jgi:hypothetical protein
MAKLMLDDHESSLSVGRKIFFDIFDGCVRMKKILKRRSRSGKRSLGRMVLWVEFDKREARRIRNFFDRALKKL